MSQGRFGEESRRFGSEHRLGSGRAQVVLVAHARPVGARRRYEQRVAWLVATTGAYGASMSNEYNLRPPAPETMLAAEPA